MKAIIALDEELAAPDGEDERHDHGGNLDVRVDDALRLWRVLENPREVLDAHREGESAERAEVRSR